MIRLTDTPVLQTDRLILRAPEAGDWPVCSAFLASDRSRFIRSGEIDLGRAWRAFGHVIGHWVLRGYGVFVLQDRVTGAAIGTSGPWFPEGWPEPEIAWTLWDPSREGQGLAAEAALASRAHAFDSLGWTTAISLILNGNSRSEALARRLGCVADGGYTHAQFGATTIWRHPAPDTQGAGIEAYA